MGDRERSAAHVALMGAQSARYVAMGLTPDEVDGFVAFLCGYAPGAVKEALDAVESDRAFKASKEQSGG